MTELDPQNPPGLRWSVQGWTPEEALKALRVLEREAFGPGAVPLFAGLEREADGSLEWTVPGAAAHGYFELTEVSRANLQARIGRRIGQLRRTLQARARVGDVQAQRLGRLVREALEIPGWGSIYAVSGEPVLAGWGHIETAAGAAQDLLIGLDDGIALAPPAGRARRPLLATATVLVLLLIGGLAAAAWAPATWLPLELNLPRCQINAADLGLLDGYGKQRDAVGELQRQVADAQGAVEQKAMACPIRVVEIPDAPKPPVKEPPKDVAKDVPKEPVQPPTQPPAQPPPQQQATAAPPAKDDLPADRWKKKELAMLQGCWTRASNMRVKRVAGPEFPVRSWRICFDKAGKGKQDLVWENGTTCSGTVVARFVASGELRIDEAQAPCSDNSYNFRATTTCQRRDDGTADCKRRLPNDQIDEGKLRR